MDTVEDEETFGGFPPPLSEFEDEITRFKEQIQAKEKERGIYFILRHWWLEVKTKHKLLAIVFFPDIRLSRPKRLLVLLTYVCTCNLVDVE